MVKMTLENLLGKCLVDLQHHLPVHSAVCLSFTIGHIFLYSSYSIPVQVHLNLNLEAILNENIFKY